MNKRQQNQRGDRAGIVCETDSDSFEHFKQRFPQRYLARFHMTLMLAAVCASGLLTSKVLLELGLRSMLVRYLVAVCVSYTVFFVLIRIWLWHVGVKNSPVPDLDVEGACDLGDVAFNGIARSGGAGSNVEIGLSGGGGDFAGAGATDTWASTSTMMPESARHLDTVWFRASQEEVVAAVASILAMKQSSS